MLWSPLEELAQFDDQTESAEKSVPSASVQEHSSKEISTSVPGQGAEKTALVSRFICEDCENPFSLSEAFLAVKPFETNCTLCDRPIALRLVHSQDHMEIVEMSGCEYAGVDFQETSAENSPQPTKTILADWIEENSDGEKTRIEPDGILNQETFLDDLMAQWKVKRRDGKEYHFQYFSALRKWIEEQKITAGDQIIPADGKAYRVETYPGTADLFGNPFARTEARFAMASRPKPKKQRHNLFKTLKQIAGVTMVAASLAYAPTAYRWWKIRQGEAFVSELTAHVTPPPSSSVVSILLNAKDLMRKGTPEVLPKATSEFIKVLVLHPKDVEVLSDLSQTLIETAALTSDRQDMKRAEQLIRFARVLQPSSANAQRAQALLLWRSGHVDSANQILENVLKTKPEDGEAHMLLARIALDQKDFGKATIHLDSALQADPVNEVYLNSFVRLFEEQSKFAEAAVYLKRAEALAANKSVYTDRLAFLYEKADNLDAAESVRRRAIERGENLETNRSALVRLHSIQKRHQNVINESLIYFSKHSDGEHYPEVDRLYHAALETVTAVTSESTPTTDSKKTTTRSSRRSSRRFSRR